MTIDRRRFLATLGASAAALATRSGVVGAGAPLPSGKLDRVGIQLYTLREQARTDLAGVLSALSRIGYKEVEFAGYYKYPASEIHELLKEHRLTAPSAHVAIDLIETQSAQTFEDARIIGHEWITVPSLPLGKPATAEDWQRIAAQFNRVATHVKSAGFRFAFHNHNDIVRKTGDILPIDILMRETDPALVAFQMDIYWAVNGGADPIELLARYPGRFRMLHVKDGQRPPGDVQTDVGAGTIDFKSIFARAKGVEHYFVESDSAADPLAFAAASYKYLSHLDF